MCVVTNIWVIIWCCDLYRWPAMLYYAAWCSLVVFEIGVLECTFLGTTTMFFIPSGIQICSANSYFKAPLYHMYSVPHSQSSKCVAVQGLIEKHFICKTYYLFWVFKMMQSCIVIFVLSYGFSPGCVFWGGFHFVVWVFCWLGVLGFFSIQQTFWLLILKLAFDFGMIVELVLLPVRFAL